LEFIRLFRSEHRLDGQEEYYLTNLESAAEFIYNMSYKDLKIDKNEYERLYDLAKNSNPSESVDLLNL